MKEIKVGTTTIYVPSEKQYTTEDLERMFGWRIRRAIKIMPPNENGRSYKVVLAKKMFRIIKRWKFWNADIRKAFRNHVGMIIVPWIIRYEEPEVIICDEALKNKYDEGIKKEYYETLRGTKED